MNLYDIVNYTVIDTQNGSLGLYQIPYVVFNTTEALIWLYVAVAILVRYLRHGKDKIEILYFLSFLAFALSDVIETSGTTLLLLLFKGACILAIIGYRRKILMQYGSKYY